MHFTSKLYSSKPPYNAKNRFSGWSDENEELMLVKNTAALGYSPPQVFPPTSPPWQVMKDPSDTWFLFLYYLKSHTLPFLQFSFTFFARCFSSHLQSKKSVFHFFFSFLPFLYKFLCAVITPFSNTHSFSSFLPPLLSSLFFILLTHTVGNGRHWQELLSQTGTHYSTCVQEL